MTTLRPHVRIGSRGSQLALWQSNFVADQLRAHGCDVSVEVIRTTGDAKQVATFAEVGTKGMFTKEIEEALFEGRIDLAVHSLKDLPTELAAPFVLAALPSRADARDAFVSERYEGFSALPSGARVGTSSVRRRAQLRALRHDLEYVEFRGNVDTRLRKLAEGQVEAIILASAGLDRLGRADHIRQRFPVLTICPAAGQGALALETRAEDEATISVLRPLDDSVTRFAVSAERAALDALGGGCQVPIGAHCTPVDGGFHINGIVAAPDGSAVVRAEFEHRSGATPEMMGRELAQRLAAQGAEDLLRMRQP